MKRIVQLKRENNQKYVKYCTIQSEQKEKKNLFEVSVEKFAKKHSLISLIVRYTAFFFLLVNAIFNTKRLF